MATRPDPERGSRVQRALLSGGDGRVGDERVADLVEERDAIRADGLRRTRRRGHGRRRRGRGIHRYERHRSERGRGRDRVRVVDGADAAEHHHLVRRRGEPIVLPSGIAPS